MCCFGLGVDSHFWVGLMKVKQTFLNYGSFQLNDGNQIGFWDDKWLGNRTVREQYPALFNIVRKKHTTVASVFDRVPLNLLHGMSWLLVLVMSI